MIERLHVSRRAIFRQVNEKICEIDAGFGIAGSVYQVLCECGRVECYSRIEVPSSLYDDVRRSARRFVVARGHHGREPVVSNGLAFAVVDSA